MFGGVSLTLSVLRCSSMSVLRRFKPLVVALCCQGLSLFLGGVEGLCSRTDHEGFAPYPQDTVSCGRSNSLPEKSFDRVLRPCLRSTVRRPPRLFCSTLHVSVPSLKIA